MSLSVSLFEDNYRRLAPSCHALRPSVIVAKNGCENPVSRIRKKVQELIGERNAQKIDQKKLKSIFIRDSQILRGDGFLSIPRLTDELGREQINIDDTIGCWPFLPPSLFHLMLPDDPMKLAGKGGQRELLDLAKASIEKFQFPFKIQNAFLEGGNVFFLKREEELFAVVGELSLVWSLRLLLSKGKLRDIAVDRDLEPSDHAYYLARNTQLQVQFFSSDVEEKNVDELLQLLQKPISTEEKEKYYDDALFWESCLTHTKELMAEDLGISKSNLILVPQRKFHIDMEMMTTVEGEVLLHDEVKASLFLEELMDKSNRFNKRECDLISRLREDANNKLVFCEVKNRIEEILASRGIPVMSLPLSYESPSDRIVLNYANGIHLKMWNGAHEGHKRRKVDSDYVYLTTGPTLKEEQKFHQMALEVIQAHLSDTKIVGVDGISRFIFFYHGGVRCMTIQTDSY